MPEETRHGMECSQFEGLLNEAIDGELTAARKEAFEAHGRICPICGPLLADVVAGQQWLKSLEEVEPPAHMVHNILVATSGVTSTRAQAVGAGIGSASVARVREWWNSFAAPTFAFVRQPRFAMSFGMIFFSFSLVLSAAGVKPGDIAKIDLRPNALKQKYYTTEGRVVKFYDNIRFVYEMQSRVREFKRATTPAEPGPEQPNKNRKNTNDNTSGQPDEKQERNYSRDENQPVLADLMNDEVSITPSTSYEPTALSQHGVGRSSQHEAHSYLVPPAVTVTTIRRFV